MKLFLSSAGLTNKSLINAFENLVGQKGENIKIAFIPTAANVEPGDKDWLINDYSNLKEQGYFVDIVDISAVKKEIWLPRLEEANTLFFGGGNTFHLRYWIEKSELLPILPRLLEDRVYVGISAGSVLATPSLTLSNDDRDLINGVGEKVYENGLGYTNFLIKPHLNNKFFPERTFTCVRNEAEKVDISIYALDDNSAVVIKEGKIEVVSEGKWRKFD